MLEDIWAKRPKETLAEHTNLVVQNLLALKERYFESIPDQGLWEDAFIAALFHDLGKLCENFQDMIQPDRSIEIEQLVRHEFLSGMYLFANNFSYYKENPLSLFAVFSHHKALTKQLFDKNTHLTLRIKEKYLKEFLAFAKNWLESVPEVEFQFSDPAQKNLQLPYKKLVRQYQTRCLPLLRDFKPAHRKSYIFHKALLNIADWTASGHRNLEPGLIYGEATLTDKIVEKLRKEGKQEIADGFEYRAFQKESRIDQNILAVAPTGSGKTEASLLWASQKKAFEHIFYLLPTRVTSNAIFGRLCHYFGKEKVAIVHSSAFFLQKEIDESYPEKEYAFIDKAFFKNVTVCTVDQILTQGFNLGFWEVKTFHQLNARVIIDEIHLYQPYTLGLIIATIRYLQDEFGAKFYIMTATMPSKLRALLQKHLAHSVFIADQELLDKARNIFWVYDKGFDDIKDQVFQAFKEGKKVLLVLNTVDSAITAYQYFKQKSENKKNILCYHSRFIQKDRGEKEKQIFELEAQPGGCLLVATQVVEVSLDIDFDILFTENAPIDAIIQRAGRVNRKRKKKGTSVNIFEHSEVTEKFVYDAPNILKNTFQELQAHNGTALSESTLLKLVDRVYQDYNVELEEPFKNGLTRYDLIQQDLNYILDLVSKDEVFTREGLDTINVIPDRFQESLHGKGIMEKSKHEVAIRLSRFRKLKSVEDPAHKWFKYVDVDYDLETGLKFNKSVDSGNPVSQHF